MRYLLILFLFSSVCFAGTRHPSSTDEQHKEYGEKFAHTLMILLNTESSSAIGSCVAISDYHLLTAAHVVENAKTGVVINPKTKKQWKIREICIPKEFDKEKFLYKDIALVTVEEPLGFTKYPKLYTSDKEIGKICSISGYGVTGTFDTGRIPGAHEPILRAGSNKVIRVDGDCIICDASTSKETSLEYLIDTGDSGGPLFIGQMVAGISSGVIDFDKDRKSIYGNRSCHTRVSIFVPWINMNMKRMSKQN